MWYSRVVADLSNIPDFIAHYENELNEAKKECRIGGFVERNIKELPGITEHRFNQLQERVNQAYAELGEQIAPTPENVFRALKETPVDQVKVDLLVAQHIAQDWLQPILLRKHPIQHIGLPHLLGQPLRASRA